MDSNVYKWCQDGLRRYDAQIATDPVGPTDRGADRALRGGSWFSDARSARRGPSAFALPEFSGLRGKPAQARRERSRLVRRWI